MPNCRDAVILQSLDRLDDLVAEIDGADAQIALLDTCRLALHVDLEPDTADAGRLDGRSLVSPEMPASAL